VRVCCLSSSVHFVEWAIKVSVHILVVLCAPVAPVLSTIRGQVGSPNLQPLVMRVSITTCPHIHRLEMIQRSDDWSWVTVISGSLTVACVYLALKLQYC